MQLAIANGSIKASDESMHPGSAIAVEVCVTPQPQASAWITVIWIAILEAPEPNSLYQPEKHLCVKYIPLYPFFKKTLNKH